MLKPTYGFSTQVLTVSELLVSSLILCYTTQVMPFTVVSPVFSMVLKTTVQDSTDYLSLLPGIFPDP